MPRFYFDVREDSYFARDDEGAECEDLEAAEHMAAQSAACIARDLLPQNVARLVTVEVRNEHNEHVLRVTVGMETERLQPEAA